MCKVYLINLTDVVVIIDNLVKKSKEIINYYDTVKKVVYTNLVFYVKVVNVGAHLMEVIDSIADVGI